MMFSGIYCSLSGMKAYSQGLDVISDNVANLNSTGYKRTQLHFRDAFYSQNSLGDNGNAQFGEGVTANKTSYILTQGEIRDTGNSTDAAIDGNGFFILQDDDGNIFLTRAGQFDIDEDGYVIDKSSGMQLMALSGGGLEAISISDYRVDEPVPTDRATFSGNLSTGTAKHVIDDLEIIDSSGEKKTLTVNFINNDTVTSGSWIVEIVDDSGTVISAANEIRFDPNGSPSTGWNEFTFTYSGPTPQDITLFFGDPGSFSGATWFAGGTTSTLAKENVNGTTIGSLTEVTFSDDGRLVRKYSNGQEHEGENLAIGWVEDPQHLLRNGKGMFVLGAEQKLHVAQAGSDGTGYLVSGAIELSNVDLTGEFTDMIIIQRGYQASSQVLTTANEMMQQLLDVAKGG